MRLRSRALAAVIVAAFVTLSGTGTAVAYTAGSGFSATTYATLPSGSAAGVAFIGPVMYVVDPVGGGLYRVPAAGSISFVGAIPGGPTGLAASGGFLYATRSIANDVVRIDPVLGTFTTIATSAAFAEVQLNALAADPVTGDLYVTSASGYIWLITAPGAPTATPSLFYALNANPPTYGIAVAGDHSLYVAVPSGVWGGIWQIAGGAQGIIDAPFAGARGVGVIPGYVFSNNSDGSITKLVIPGMGTGSTQTALSGGSAGDLATIGADGCFYASQGATVIRLADALGGCNLGNATPPPPPTTLTLELTSTNAPLIGNGDQTFSATLANAPITGDVAITFTVTRGTTSTTTTVVTTAPNGTASFGYAATTPGTDVITASAVVNGNTITSNAITVDWTRALDTIPPLIMYTVTGTQGAVFSCPNPLLGTPGSSEYCGWYTSPVTVHFDVTQQGETPVSYSCPDFTLYVNSPIDGTAVTCTATNADGFSSALKVVLQALITAPTITASASTPSGPYVGGPTSSNVTVTFACVSDPALGPEAISFCTAPVTVSAEGYTTVNGFVLDVAGTRVNASFGPILIDRTGPVITATMTTATDGLPYVPGTPTTQDVIVTFVCVDAFDPHPSCPSPVTVSSGSSATVTATDWLGNKTTSTFGGIVIDRVGPVVGAVISPVPDTNGNNALTATVNITATDLAGLASITYSATGAQTIAPTTVTLAGHPTTFTLPVVLNAIGTTTVSWSATDALGNVSGTGTTTVKIIATQPTTLAITSASTQAQGGTTVSAQLLGLGGAPVAGKTVTFTIGTTTVSAITNAYGIASASISLAPGTYSLTASFAGVTGYLPSTAGPQTLIIFGATQFVIWGGNGVLPGQRVVFWGEKWWDASNLPEKSKVKDFKGYADTVTGTTWTTKSGNSKPPETIPAFISVIVTTSIERVGKDGIQGSVTRHAILRVDSPYKNEPAKPVYGVVVAVLP